MEFFAIVHGINGVIIQITAIHKRVFQKVLAIFAEAFFIISGGQPRPSRRRCTQQHTQIV